MYLLQDTFLRRLVDRTQTYQPLSSANPNLTKFGIRTRKFKNKSFYQEKKFPRVVWDFEFRREGGDHGKNPVIW